ncbi:M24 family metallopeptidase [Cytobacillus oceanisediminis]|uniref:M24 family metallopeptidase n=1 Tax=Cytobacillus oceanisediminis TaxID=665099 RepID=UPI002040CBF3|nr:M24 family metallopeptidase [Cytobacillus oceanisediminis]MCM3392711.1 M24 family metallopeptidase [Cytobacillus oceanisediminis]MCM3403197.1 M24 family metallopeptidase [Cytobacillus oceanisediminis]MCM3531235.1 M24 family metallopeptidase [Cytobacillus oceanisediminis]MDK7666250.1 M24 family metallopeptidase [Cytobacillus oceanisediminis]USK42160.1 M24 family metallopeptidase [Cytobacillus oceanisediminis]
MSFGTAEYKERILKTRERMAAEGIEVLLITDPANMNYLSGYDGWSFYVHQMLVIIIDEEQPIWIGRGQDANGAKVTTWLYHENIIPYPDDYVQSETRHPMDFVAEILKQIGQQNRFIGVEMDNYYFTAKCYEQLKKGLPNASFRDASLLVNWVRIIKSDTEIEYMKRAAKIVEKTMAAGIELVNEGVRECDVAAKIFHTQITGTDEFGGDYPAIMPLLPSGERTSTPHLTWTDQRYKSGELVILELAGCYKRYHSPLARTVHIGQPSEKIKSLSEVVVEGLNACLDMIKPGIACEEIEEAWRKSIEKSGIIKESRLGYSMGLNYPPDWGEHTASIRKGDKTILQPNMTFHLIPGIWLDQYGFEASESFRVTENGCETFAELPRHLYIKEASLSNI